MIRYLFTNRYRPRLGTRSWLKYWLKRALLLRELLHQERLHRHFSKRCRTFGKRNALADVTVMGRKKLLAIGDDCAIGRANIQLHDSVTIGNAVVINDGVTILTGSHDINEPRWPLIKGKVVVDDFAWLATGSAVLPNVSIGRGAVVGAFAVVAKSVPPLAIVVGNPARIIGYRKENVFDYRPNRLFALFEAWIGPQDCVGTTNVTPAAQQESSHALTA